MLITFLVFHLEISGKDKTDEQSLNKLLISLTFEISHLEISGNVSNDSKPQNK